MKEQFKNKFKEVFDEQITSSFETALQGIKNEGATIRDSVFVVAIVLNISIQEADVLVLNSETWSGIKKRVLGLRKEISSSVQKAINKDEE
jgi:hypothetical protein